MVSKPRPLFANTSPLCLETVAAWAAETVAPNVIKPNATAGSERNIPTSAKQHEATTYFRFA
jgi:hypothetical protein